MFTLQPLSLEGRVVSLHPLAENHAADLTLAAQSESIWRHMAYGDVRTEPQMMALIVDLLGRQARGTDLPFTVFHRGSGRAVGMTRFMDIQPHNRALEIGGTWYAAEFQRTAVNTECKYLLLRQAFEGYGCIRVQLKTDLRNERSQRAIERIGAQREGVLRDHWIMPNGHIRSSVYYSILAAEWPAVKNRLEERLAAPSAA